MIDAAITAPRDPSTSCRGGESPVLIQILLEAGKDQTDFVRLTQFRNSVGDGIVVLETQQRSELIERIRMMLRILRASTPVASFCDVVRMVGIDFSLS